MLAGLQIILDQDPSIQVVKQKLPCSACHLHEMQPDVIIYDTTGLRSSFCDLLAAELPGLLLIGLDSERHQVLVWSGRQLPELSSRDLIEIIHRATDLESQE